MKNKLLKKWISRLFLLPKVSMIKSIDSLSTRFVYFRSMFNMARLLTRSWPIGLRKYVFKRRRVLKERSAEQDDVGIDPNIDVNLENSDNSSYSWLSKIAFVTWDAVFNLMVSWLSANLLNNRRSDSRISTSIEVGWWK